MKGVVGGKPSPYIGEVMKSTYREKTTISGKNGQYLEVDIFPIFEKAISAVGNSRNRAQRRATNPLQEMLNAKNCARRLARVVNCNFDSGDLKFELTYATPNAPADEREAQRILQNFIRRIKRFYAKHNLPEVKYITVTEIGSRTGRIHHHVIMTGGISPADLARIWGLGYVQKIQPLQPDDKVGLVGIANYMCGFKEGGFVDKISYRRYNASRNLKQPKTPRPSDYKYSKKRVRQIAENEMSYEEIEKLYPEYEVAEINAIKNELFGGYYIYLRLFKPPKGKNKG